MRKLEDISTRKYKNPSKDFHPGMHAMKNFLSRICNIQMTITGDIEPNLTIRKRGEKRRNTLHDIRDQYMKLEEARLLHNTLKQMKSLSGSVYEIPAYISTTTNQNSDNKKAAYKINDNNRAANQINTKAQLDQWIQLQPSQPQSIQDGGNLYDEELIL